MYTYSPEQVLRVVEDSAAPRRRVACDGAVGTARRHVDLPQAGRFFRWQDCKGLALVADPGGVALALAAGRADPVHAAAPRALLPRRRRGCRRGWRGRRRRRPRRCGRGRRRRAVRDDAAAGAVLRLLCNVAAVRPGVAALRPAVLQAVGVAQVVLVCVKVRRAVRQGQRGRLAVAVGLEAAEVDDGPGGVAPELGVGADVDIVLLDDVAAVCCEKIGEQRQAARQRRHLSRFRRHAAVVTVSLADPPDDGH